MTEAVAAPPEAGALLEWMREREGELISFLQTLVLAESPTTDPGAQGPVFELLAAPLRAAGYETRRFAGTTTGGQLYARPETRPKGRPFQLLLGHVDTVWPTGTLSRMPAVVEDGRLCGPGVFDMKGGVAEIVFALRALHELDLQPPLVPVVLLNSDEEIGSPESQARILHLARRSSRALVLEPALGKEGALKTARRGFGRMDVRVRGKSAHSGLAPEEGASAIEELARLIRELHALSDPERGVTVNVGIVRGGTRANVVAAEATAAVDLRVSRREDGPWLERRIRDLVAGPGRTPGTTVELTGGMERAPMERTPRNRRLWEAAREVGRALGLELEEGTSGGASDANLTTELTATLDGLGPVGDGAHADHEHVVTESLPERAALLAALLLLPDLRPPAP